MLAQPNFLKRSLLLAVLAIPVILFGLLRVQPVSAAGPSIISFQGKVVNADGTNETGTCPTSYNFDFVLYDDPT